MSFAKASETRFTLKKRGNDKSNEVIKVSVICYEKKWS
jgi:hypothetical protein